MIILMDIRRIKVEHQYKYIDKKTKKRITDKKILKRIKEMRIPPGYSKVKISKKAKDKIQATGIDDAGRKQYIYSKKFVKEQQEIKFQDLIQSTLRWSAHPFRRPPRRRRSHPHLSNLGLRRLVRWQHTQLSFVGD